MRSCYIYREIERERTREREREREKERERTRERERERETHPYHLELANMKESEASTTADRGGARGSSSAFFRSSSCPPSL